MLRMDSTFSGKPGCSGQDPSHPEMSKSHELPTKPKQLHNGGMNQVSLIHLYGLY